MPRDVLTSEQLLTTLAEGPPHLAEYTAGLTKAQLHAEPGPGEWSANEVLAHLRSCADVWGGCIARILEEDKPTFRAVNPRAWITKTNYPEQEFQSSLQAFTTQRTALLAVLGSLSPKAWSRSAKVTGAGKALDRTVYSYVDWMVEHEGPHLKKSRRIANTMRTK